MPRGDNPNSRKNLKRPSREEARERGSLGGKKSAETRGVYKDLRESMREALTPEMSDKIIKMLAGKIQAGNLKALELAMKMTGADISPNKSTLEELQAEKLRKEISGEISDTHITVKFESADGGASDLSV